MENQSNTFHFYGFDPLHPPTFNGNDYGYWKNRFSWFLQAIDLDLWDVIEEDWNVLDERFIKANQRAIEILWCAMEKDVFKLVCHCTLAKDIWAILENNFGENRFQEELHVNQKCFQNDLHKEQNELYEIQCEVHEEKECLDLNGVIDENRILDTNAYRLENSNIILEFLQGSMEHIEMVLTLETRVSSIKEELMSTLGAFMDQYHFEGNNEKIKASSGKEEKKDDLDPSRSSKKKSKKEKKKKVKKKRRIKRKGKSLISSANEDTLALPTMGEERPRKKVKWSTLMAWPWRWR